MAGEVRSVVVRLSASVAGYVAGMGQADAATAKVERGLTRLSRTHLSTDKVMSRVGKAGGLLFVGAAAGIAVAEKKAADFNSEMATVQTLSHANTRQFDLLSKAARSVGVNIGYSATDSAAAEEELIKAGVKLKDILGGGLKGALDLAAAGQTDVGTATSVAASAMTQFKLKGKDVPHIADLLAAGADKALGSVTDLGFGLSQVGTQAHQMGFSIEDTVGTLAEFAQSGLIGEKGGATLKQMFLQLAAPTKNAQGLMDKYGLSLYKANGQIKSMPQLANNLQRSFKDLTPAQRNQALGVIFGSRAIQGANILIRDGEKKNRAWIKSVNDQGFAAHQASGKMNSLKGDLKKLDAQLGNAFIGQGGKQGFLRGLTQDATKLVEKYNKLSDAQKHLVGDAFKGAAVVGGSLWVANKIYSLAKGTSEVYRGVAGILRGSAAAKGGSGLGQVAGSATGTRVWVENWPPGLLVPGGRPGVGTPLVPVGAKNRPFLGTGAMDGGLAAEEAALASNLAKLSAAVGGAAGLMAVGDAGNEVTNPGQHRAGVLPSWLPGTWGQKPGRGVLQAKDAPLTAKQISLLTDAQKEELGLAKAAREAAQAHRTAAGAFGAATGVLNTANPLLGRYGKTLRSIPKNIRSYVSTPGAVTSIAQMRYIAKEYKLTPKQIRTVMRLQGYSETQGRIVAAGRAFQHLPRQVKTALRADTVKSTYDVQRLQKRYNLTPRQIRTVMQVSGVDEDIARLRALQREIAGIRSKSVTITTLTQHINKGGTGNPNVHALQADGGTVRGQRYPYGDKVITGLAPTEEVTSNRHGQADRFRRELKLINAGASRRAVAEAMMARGLADGGTPGGITAVSGGTGTSSVIVQFPSPAIYSAAVKAADDIAAAGAKYAITAQDVRAVHLDDLHQQQQIRDLNKQLAEHNTKSVGKGKHRHNVQTGLTLTGLDRTAAQAELADAKATLVEMRKQSSVQKQIDEARVAAREAQQQARSDATGTITGNLDLFSHGAAGASSYVQRYTADVAKFGNVLARLRDAKASPTLLSKMVDLANSGDFRGATRFGQSLLDQPQLLAQLNTSLGSFSTVAGGVANLTTDPRFLGTGAWNPVAQVASTVKAVQVTLGVDPSAWTTDITRRVTANVLQAINGGG